MSTAPRETAAEAAGFTWTRRHVLALAVLCLASLLDVVDVTVVNVAMPAIRESLHFSEGALAWTVNAYMVPFGGFMLLAGRAGDRFGRRRVLTGGTMLFTVSSLASALRTGVGYLPLGVSILVAAGLGPVLVPRFGVRFTVAAGALLSAIGLLLLAQLQVSGNVVTSLILPEVIIGLGAGIVTVPSSVAALAGVPAERAGVASALLNVSRQLGGALGLAVITTLITATTTHALTAGHATGAAMTAGFRSGFTVSAILLAAATVAALVLLREDGRGQRVNLIELQTAGA